MAVEIITTVLMAATATEPAGPYDLTDLDTVHDDQVFGRGNDAYMSISSINSGVIS